MPISRTNMANFLQARFWTAKRNAQGSRGDYFRIADHPDYCPLVPSK